VARMGPIYGPGWPLHWSGRLALEGRERAPTVTYKAGSTCDRYTLHLRPASPGAATRARERLGQALAGKCSRGRSKKPY